jgi:hypothetical protein
MRLEALRFVCFVQLHGETFSLAGRRDLTLLAVV